ncbi:hypothetical protein AB0B45_46245 [Nonomuraea sp. NPDC049152]|uniref:hypothetical protein n=1 Tax=Nonomuraea sp. NPDC049152 TaxID=3154350 RepID=UPI00340A3E96
MMKFKNVLVTGTLAAFAFVVPAMSAAQFAGAESVNQTPAATSIIADSGNGAANGGSTGSLRVLGSR